MSKNQQTKLYLATFLSLLPLQVFSASQFEHNAARDALKQKLQLSQYVSQFGHLLAFETEPDISGSTFYINDDIDSTLDSYKLPLQKKIFSTNGNDYYGRLGLNYGSIKSDDLWGGELPNNSIKSKWETYSGSLGLLADIPVSNNLTTTFAFDMGIARLENISSYQGVVSDIFAPVMDGILLNWTTNASIVSGVAGLKYKVSIANLDYDLQAHYTHSYVSSFSESKDFSGFSENTDTLGLKADISHPWNTSTMGYPLSGIVHLGYTTFMGPNRDVMGFSQYGEIGYSIKFDISDEALEVKSFNIGAKAIAGDNSVKGWSIIFGYRF